MNTKQIPLTKGMFAIVDEEDFERLNRFKWQTLKGNSTCYAVRKTSRKLGKMRCIYMHREIFNLEPNDRKLVDHYNHNGLHNYKCNLRVCTKRENAMNSHRQRTATAKYKGVYVGRHGKRWCARISIRPALGGKRKTFYLGTFETEILAAQAYDKKAKELFGEFAFLNFPEVQQ